MILIIIIIITMKYKYFMLKYNPNDKVNFKKVHFCVPYTSTFSIVLYDYIIALVYIRITQHFIF